MQVVSIPNSTIKTSSTVWCWMSGCSFQFLIVRLRPVHRHRNGCGSRFQFLIVRLRLSQRWPPCPGTQFQFLIVRLRHYSLLNREKTFMRFQFLIVRLRRGCVGFANQSESVSIPNSTIKTRIPTAGNSPVRVSIPNSTIKTDVKLIDLQALNCFNS